MFLNILENVPLIIFILISVVNSDYHHSDDEETTTAAFDPEEEWHMDFVPTGYLPDSVYRELAWYGILQIQPLYHSTKHKVAARWVWQNTLGRPYVIMEDSPQSTMSDKVSYQTLVEESAKWVREQRSAVDVLMENIRTGGNGLTVRTVISLTKKTVYIIQNGKFYECEPGSEPDLDAFRTQANMHQRKCTSDKEPFLVPLDICMDAEFTPIEYSFRDGWTFCMGDGDRDAIYSDDGDLDCGQKQKVLFSTFLEDCSIDNNVVISFDYFGDEPRKDLIHNATLCSTWDPCKFAYLYRIEAPEPAPEVPTTSPDPCDTTLCPECVEGFSEETYHIEDDREVIGQTDPDVLQWVNITYKDYPKYKNKAIPYVMRATYMNMTIPGKLVRGGKEAYVDINGTEELVQGYFEIPIPKENSNLKWVPAGLDFYDNAVPAGVGMRGYISYLCRANIGSNAVPGRYYKELKTCFNTHYKKIISNNEFEILVNVDTPQ